jgi:PhzF family phenazine biosynthesis protein
VNGDAGGGRRFQLIDVFGEQAFTGNPVAVVHDADDLSSEQMLQITRWLNLSETTFLLPPTLPEADYRVRIFTLERELPFAGHPTLGTAHAWLTAGGRPQRNGTIVQQCGAGLIPVRRSAQRLAFTAPPLVRSGPVERDKLDEIIGVLGVDRERVVEAAWCDNGPGWAVVLLDSVDTVLALEPARAHPSRIYTGVVGLYPPGGPLAAELRAVFSDQTGALREDPVTGSLNAAVAQWLIGSGHLAPPYVAGQGQCVGRAGRIYVSRNDDGDIEVGGQTHTLFDGVACFD